MLSLPAAILSAFVLSLTAAALGRRLHAAKTGKGAPCPTLAESEEAAVLRQKRECAEQLCGEIRRSLTTIQTAIPSSITGLPMERIRLLCADELKDKNAAASSAFRNITSDRLAGTVQQKDGKLLNAYIDELSSIAEELKHIEQSLVPAMKAAQGASVPDFHEQALTAVSRRFDVLHTILQSYARSTSLDGDDGRSVQARIRQAALAVSDPEVRAALDSLESLVQQHYDSLDRQAKARMASHYLPTLELMLSELGQAEQAGEDSSKTVELSLRTIRVLSRTIAAGGQVRREISQRSLEAEVTVLERLATMRGDTANDMEIDNGQQT